MQKQKLSQIKTNLKHYAPEIMVGLTAVAGAFAFFAVRKQIVDPKELIIAVDTPVGPIRVLEEIAKDLWFDLDREEFFTLTPWPSE